MADLQADHGLFRSADKLRQEGALLLEAAENVNTSGGRVVFSLQEIPLRRRFQTSNGNFLRRERADLVVLWAPHQSVSLKIPISNAVTTSNKDVFFWAQTQNDLLLFDDAKHLASAGAIVSEQVSGKQLEIRALTDLPIGIKYFTEHANIIQRISANEIVLGDKTLYVNPPASEESTYTGDTSESLPSSDDEAASFAGLESRIKESLELASAGVDELSLEQRFTPVKGGKMCGDDAAAVFAAAQKKAKLLEDDPKAHVVIPLAAPAPGAQSFPRATRCVVEGHGYHMDELRFVHTYTGGIEGNSTIRWERSEAGRPFMPIPNSKLPVYRPSLEDLGAEIRVAYTPVRADGVTGAIVYSNTVKIKLDPEVAAEIESNLALNTLMFKVLMRNGHEFQKRSILLTRHKLKLRKRRVTMAKAIYGRHITVAPSLEHDCHFALGLSNDEYYNFIAPSCYQRDIIVLTIQMFNEKERA